MPSLQSPQETLMYNSWLLFLWSYLPPNLSKTEESSLD